MMHFRSRVFWVFLAFLLLSGCDKGLGPSATPATPIPTGFMSGLIRYQHWPAIDSLHDLRLVAFRVFPPGNIVTEVLQGRASVYPPLGDTALVPFYVDSLRYHFSLPATRYEYVVVAQQYGSNAFTDWRAVGQFDLDSNFAVPSPVTIVADSMIEGININVDFSNPPPPPVGARSAPLLEGNSIKDAVLRDH